MPRLALPTFAALVALVLAAAAPAAPTALAAPTPPEELLVVDAASGQVTGRMKLRAYPGVLCWGPRGFETLAEPSSVEPRRAPGRFVAYAPGRAPRVVRRVGKDEEVVAAVFAPGCGRVAEVHYAFPGDAQYDGGIVVRDAAGKEAFRVETNGWPEDPQIVWSQDGTRVALSLYERGRGRTIRVHDAATGALLHRSAAPAGLRDLDGLSRDGATLTLSTSDATGYAGYTLLDVATGQTRTLLDPNAGRSFDDLVWSPAADVIAARNDGGGIELLDPALGFGPTLPTLALQPIADLTWSPDGTRIAYVHEASRGRRAGIAVVDARPGARPRRLLTPGRRALHVVGWSPDGRSLAVLRTNAGLY